MHFAHMNDTLCYSKEMCFSLIIVEFYRLRHLGLQITTISFQQNDLMYIVAITSAAYA